MDIIGDYRVNMDTEGAIESICINRVSVISGSCHQSQKYTFYFKIKIPQK